MNGISYLLILDKMSYVYDHWQTFQSWFRFQKLKDKWEEDNDIAKAAMLSHIQDDLIPLFKDCKMVKEILSTLEIKYGRKSNTAYNCCLKSSIP